MMRIPCPWCGPRDEPEFGFGGEPQARPPISADDAAWADYLYGRANARGSHREIWCHTGGCGQWFVMERDTTTHEIAGTTTPRTAPP